MPDRLFKHHGHWRSESAKDGYVKDSGAEALSFQKPGCVEMCFRCVCVCVPVLCYIYVVCVMKLAACTGDAAQSLL